MSRPASPVDPRAVLFAFISVTVWIGISRTLLGTGLLAAGALILVWRLQGANRLTPGIPGGTLRWSLPMTLAIMILYTLLGADNSHSAGIFGGLNVSWEGVSKGVRLGLRFIAFIALARAMTVVTTPSPLAAGVTRLLWPLKAIGVKVESVYYLVFFTARMFPTLTEEIHAVRMGQRSRGVRFDGSWLQRVRLSPAILVPAFAASIRRADRLSMALTSRGFDVHRLPREVRRLHFQPHDWGLLGVIAVGWAVWLTFETFGLGARIM